MRRQHFDDNNRYNVPAMPPAVSPITQPRIPPTPPIMQPRKPMGPPCPFAPPGTVFNPIGVPPWATQPSMPPTGVPATQPPSMMPSPSRPPSVTIPQPGPPVLTNDGYMQAHLKQYIGRPVKVQFILGTNMFVDREGTLIDVGIDHIVMRETRTDDLLFADFYSIKFVTILL
ncbi:MAG: hypothetical protein WDA24_02890 [Tissierellales bacterium]